MNKKIEKDIKEMTKKADDILFVSKDEDYNTANEFIDIDIVDYFPYGKYSVMHDIIKKTNRLQSLLIGNKSPNNEAIGDTFIDLLNYVRIGHAILKSRGDI